LCGLVHSERVNDLRKKLHAVEPGPVIAFFYILLCRIQADHCWRMKKNGGQQRTTGGTVRQSANGMMIDEDEKRWV